MGQAKYVMADDGHKARVAPPWTEEKLKILDGYLPNFAKACAPAGGWYGLDPFAGGGLNFSDLREADWQQAAREEHLAGRPKFGVTNSPLRWPCVLLAREVHAHGSPVANDIIEQEAWRPIMLDGLVKVAPQNPSSSIAEHRGRGQRHRLEQEQHATREVLVVVVVQSDVFNESVAENRLPEWPSGSGRVIKNATDGLNRRRDFCSFAPVQQKHEVVVAARGDFGPSCPRRSVRPSTVLARAAKRFSRL